MKKRESISKIMTSQVHKLELGKANLYDAKEMLEKNHIRHLPVVKGEKLVGMISLTDIHRLSFGANFGDDQKEVDTAIFDMLTVEQVMKHHPRTISTESTIKEAAEILSKEEFHALPVEEEGRLAGIVTSTDLINYLIEQY